MYAHTTYRNNRKATTIAKIAMEKNKPHYDWNHTSNTRLGVKYMNLYLPQLPQKVTTMTTVEKQQRQVVIGTTQTTHASA